MEIVVIPGPTFVDTRQGDVTCPACGGAGFLQVVSDRYVVDEPTCRDCSGKGWV